MPKFNTDTDYWGVYDGYDGLVVQRYRMVMGTWAVEARTVRSDGTLSEYRAGLSKLELRALSLTPEEAVRKYLEYREGRIRSLKGQIKTEKARVTRCKKWLENNP